MFAYYFNLALRSFRRDRALTALMVLAVALGIGACMTTLTVFRVLSGDPIPSKSDRLFYVQLDAASRDGYTPGEEPNDQLTRYDAEALLREKRAPRQALTTGGFVKITPERSGQAPFTSAARFASADFFPMFEVPMLYGSGWSSGDDDARARVVVLGKETNERLFGGGNSVGQRVLLDRTEFTVVGVVDQWRPTPRFYDLTNDRFAETEGVFLPFSTSRDLNLDRQGNIDCWGDTGGDSTGPNAPCAWMQYWVELESPAQAAAYRDYLVNYSDQQRAAGRFERPTNVRLRNVMELLEYNRVVPQDVVMQLWLGFGFLLVCLVNTIGLLLAKFLRRGSEIGVRRALGASRGAIFAQCLVEAGTVGLFGGVLGLGLAMLGLWGVRQQPASYANLAHLDGWMLLLTFVLAVASSVLAGVVPAWRAMQVAPAIQLKSQ
ncbi:MULTISPECIES: ABC transporter permease [Pseudoxanthomonas]|uniref:Putative ABC transport system permease protein n=1 Tax=Pseudoxanthomonas taiwanensis J19 TaxID=935569 RepID=A0A562DKM5_9GAMM|nr:MULTISPECIES: ABC transporter permease [Pseudoxanthomonas]TWH10181.1 putative ABC transport system permease protein [Pseudoxanthomonas taiwanensis J19]